MAKGPCSDERKAAMSAARKAWFAALSDEEKVRRKAYQAAKLAEAKARRSPEFIESANRKRGASVSVSAKANPEKRSAAAKKNWRTRTPATRKKTIDAIHAARDLPATRAKIGASRKISQAGYDRVADSVKAHWATLTREERTGRIKRALHAGLKLYPVTMWNPATLQMEPMQCPFHSSWEAALAQTLVELGLDAQTQVPFDLGGRLYVADFVIAPNIVIEVKGTRPECWRRWVEETRPGIEAHLPGRAHVYLLTRKLKSETFSTLADLLAEMERVI